MRRLALTGIAAVLTFGPMMAVAQNRPAASSVSSTAQARPGQPAQQPMRPAQPGQGPQHSQIPQPAGLLVLIRGSLIALNQANQTGNYTVLHALGSDSMRATTNPQTLAQSFAGFRQRNIDLSPAMFLNPQLTRAAAIEGGRLHLIGYFPTQPMRITFDFWFEPSQGHWKFVQLNAGLAPVQAQPQQAQPSRPQQPQPQAPQPQSPQRR